MAESTLFNKETQKSSYKFVIIFIVLIIAAFGSAYGIWKYISYEPEISDEQIAEWKTRDSIVMLLAQPTFSGEEFRNQILGDARLQKFVIDKKEVYFSLPESGENEFKTAIDKFITDTQKIENAELIDDKKFKLDKYSLVKSTETGYFFKTSVENLKFDKNTELEFPYPEATYTLKLPELLELSNNDNIYGGRIAAATNPKIDGKAILFGNHGAFVAKPNEPSLERFAENLLKDLPENATREMKIQKLLDFVSKEIEYDYYEALGRNETLKRPNETLMTRKSDCSNKTILMASLLEQIGEEYLLLYCPQHITVAVPQGNFEVENNLNFKWSGKNWIAAETTLPMFQIGKTKVTQTIQLNTVNYVQNPKQPEIIFESQTFRPLEFR